MVPLPRMRGGRLGMVEATRAAVYPMRSYVYRLVTTSFRRINPLSLPGPQRQPISSPTTFWSVQFWLQGGYLFGIEGSCCCEYVKRLVTTSFRPITLPLVTMPGVQDQELCEKAGYYCYDQFQAKYPALTSWPMGRSNHL